MGDGLRGCSRMTNVRRWLIVEACGVRGILAPEGDVGWRCVGGVRVNSAWSGRWIFRSSVMLARLGMYVVCTHCFGGT